MRTLVPLLLLAAAACTPRGDRADSTAHDSATGAATTGDLSGPSRADTTRPRADTTLPTRGDGRATNPPIHRTVPRDEDVRGGTPTTPPL